MTLTIHPCFHDLNQFFLPTPVPSAPVPAVLEMFRRKTAPAFDVALQLGAILAGADQGTRAVLASFSSLMGIAYQVSDDLDDYAADSPASGAGHFHPSIMAALARELPSGPDDRRRIAAEARARELLRQYEDDALRALRPLRQPALKRLLYRVAALLLHQPSPS
jgi:geranylgeranyl pyrophosphate synthase